MKEKFKNFLSSLTKIKKPILFAVLFFVVFGLIIPISPAHAGGMLSSIFKISSDVVKGAAEITFGVFFQFLALIGNVLLSIAAAILDWAINLDLPYTQLMYQGEKTIVGVGWPLVRDLADMGIILALVYIGIATALRLADFNTKQTLIRLIGVALLINFTPVICGAIVDASNILMHFFLEGVSGWNTLSETFAAQTHSWTELIEHPGEGTFLGQSIALSAYGFIGTIVLLLYALLIIMRYVAIWILVILSPIAFFCYILPATRDIFTKWWNQFLQWCLIGVTAAFFLYLGRHMLYLVHPEDPTKGFIPVVLSGDNAVYGGVLPYFVVIVFLLLGLFVGFSTSTMGAGGVIAGFQKGTKAAGAVTRKRVGKEIRETPPVTRAEGRIRKWLERMPVIGGVVGGPGAFEAEKAKRKEEYVKSLEAGNSADIRSTIKGKPALQPAGLEILAKRGSLTDTDKQFLPYAKLYGADMSKILKARPDWAPDIKPERVTELMQQKNIGRKEAEEKVIEETIEKITPGDFRENTQTEALTNPVVIKHFMKDESKFRDIEKNGTAAQKKQIKDTFQTNFYFAESNLPPEDVPLMKRRAYRLSTDPRWFPTEEELKREKEAEARAEARAKFILPGTEEYRKAEEERRRGVK